MNYLIATLLFVLMIFQSSLSSNNFKVTFVELTQAVKIPFSSSDAAEKLEKAIQIETLRVSHAKELLGKSFAHSDAKRIPSAFQWKENLERYLSKRLPASHKSQAAVIANTVVEQSIKAGFDPVFVMAVINTESSFNPIAKGPVGEIGMMQLRLQTAQWMSEKYKLEWKGEETLRNPVKNIILGVTYLKWLRDQSEENPKSYVPAYNMGLGNVQKLAKRSVQPKEYSLKVMKNYTKTYSRLLALNSKGNKKAF